MYLIGFEIDRLNGIFVPLLKVVNVTNMAGTDEQGTATK